MKNNLLIKSDNIAALNYLLENNYKSKIDLIYIDPPFSTKNVFTISKNRFSTISRSVNGKIAYGDKITGQNFIKFLEDRLILLRELLSDNGSIYLHIDYKVGHKIKILMDKIFGEENFRNDITRIKSNPKNFSKVGYGNVKDLILFYTKSRNPIWNEPREPYSEDDVMKLFPKVDKDGNRYTTVPIHAPGETKKGKSNTLFKGLKPPVGRHWRTDPKILEQWDKQGLIEWSKNNNPRKKFYFNDNGKRICDIWNFKDPQYPVYPTEKNLDLLKLIIRTSSVKNSIVLDCFCGSGTTMLASQILGRKWIGIDESAVAINAFKNKIKNIQNISYKYLNSVKNFSNLEKKARIA
jgi:adenine-specific DNA-methyltransferase